MHSQEPENLKHDTQVLEASDMGNIRSLLNVLLEVDTVLLVLTSFSLKAFVCFG